MIELIKEYKVQSIIIAIVTIGLIIGLFMLVNSFNRSDESGVYVNDEFKFLTSNYEGQENLKDIKNNQISSLGSEELDKLL